MAELCFLLNFFAKVIFRLDLEVYLYLWKINSFSTHSVLKIQELKHKNTFFIFISWNMQWHN